MKRANGIPWKRSFDTLTQRHGDQKYPNAVNSQDKNKRKQIDKFSNGMYLSSVCTSILFYFYRAHIAHEMAGDYTHIK